jgi:hypothetical protein
MKTVRTFLKIIYWANEKYICIIFLHNLPHAQYKFSNTYKEPEFLWKKIFWLAVQPVMHRSVYLFIRSKRLLPSASVSSPNMW